NLGLALNAQGKREEAVGHFRKAITLDPKYAQAHVNLGVALNAQGRPAEAARHFKKAIALNPKYILAHAALGQALLALGRWPEARDATRRSLDLMPPRHPQQALAAQQLERCERMLSLEARLPAVLQGKDRPAGAAECLDFAALCQATRRHAA